MVSRRTFLTVGGAAALVTATGVGLAAYLPGPASARAPWSQAGDSFGDPRLDALAYAILAPNPHNRQPWMFDLVGDDRIDVYCDLDKLLPHTDPPNRQITIGFGCMLELLRLAGQANGYDVKVDPFPDGQPYPTLNGNRIAQVTFTATSTPNVDGLFDAVLQRRSLKEPFDIDRPVPVEPMLTVVDAGRSSLTRAGTIAGAQVGRLIDICWRAWMIEYETEITRRESIDLMRIGNREVAANPDGIDLGGTAMGLMKLSGFVTRKALDTPGSQAYTTGIDMYRDIISSAQGFVWIIAEENTRVTQLQAGADWVRMNLAAQKLGLGLHPLSQCLQEFPEMGGPYDEIHREVSAPRGGVVHMLGRIGYASFPPPSPRWPLTAKLIDE